MILGLVLAGGRSVRMGREKAFVPLAGRPLVAHVIARMAPQVDTLVINANGDLARFDRFGLGILADWRDLGLEGPLAGVLAGLIHAEPRGASHLATVPCDAPFLPRDLVRRLAAAAGPGEIALAESEAGVEPVFGLWPMTALPALLEAARSGEQSLRGAAARAARVRRVRFIAAPGEPDPFLNLNRPEDLASAEARLVAPGKI